MPESPEQKNKRQFLERLNSYVWDRQISIFFDDYEDTLDAIEHSAKIRENLPRAFPDSPFLYRLCKTRPKPQLIEAIGIPESEPKAVPFLVFFTTNFECETSELNTRVSKWIGASVNVMQQKFSDTRKTKYASSVSNQRPHDLKAFFGDRKITRSTLLNKKKLVKKDSVG